ncbi:MAG TPA: DUF1501 domain-containing protein [Candidatus Dormibacteraeota bacterium]|nr:DUF1501 domain-containing protein [Candidatus Dormibacteraeota bacterium]
MTITRRVFLKNTGIAIFGMTAMPMFLRNAMAASTGTGKRVMVVLFQRGAVDGLNVVVPYAERNYYSMRPTIAIPRPGQGGGDGARGAAIDLDGFFGLHPNLAPIEPLYRQGLLAVVHATGSPDPSRSHFDAQDYMEAGTPGVKSTVDGWLNRALQQEREPRPSTLRAIAASPNLPLTLRGQAPAIAVPDLRQFKFFGSPRLVETNFEAMYANTVDKVMRGVGQETFEAVNTLGKLDPQKYQPANGAVYPSSHFGHGLREIAQLIKADVGMEAAFLDSGGWDHHVNEGAVQGRMGNLLTDLGHGLSAFASDLGPRIENVVFVSMSEFGRTAHENGNRGTDHGHGNYMFVMGGAVKGGKVYGRWPGLAPEQLNQDRDLKVTTDYRTVLGEILRSHMGIADFSTVFPDFIADRPSNFLNLIRS